ncbi:MAG: hypothetical protein JNL08_02620 [Planctomycetes bacterium]|nr:hypothetical protein [Planctomycetota bacterium]
MALKKSQLLATRWSSCDALREVMDASHYMDYVLDVLSDLDATATRLAKSRAIQRSMMLELRTGRTRLR